MLKLIAAITLLFLSQSNAAARALLVNGSYHSVQDTEKYSILCSVNLEFSNNGRKLIMSMVDNQVNGVFCVDKEAMVYKCEQDTGAGRVACVNEINPDNKLNFTVANDHRFVVTGTKSIYTFINAGIKKASLYVYDTQAGWTIILDNQMCQLTPEIVKRCLDITKEEIEKYICPTALTEGLAAGKFLCDSHEDSCRKVYSSALPEFTKLYDVIGRHGCRTIVAYKKGP